MANPFVYFSFNNMSYYDNHR
jgi:hypothetical protein